MEQTKIPRPALIKLGAFPKLLPLPPLTKTSAKVTTKETNRFLRRRSKSVTDLRTKLPEKVERLQPLKQAVKRSAPPLKNNENNKPKVAKQQRIPEWDYKSRFGELQKKYSNMGEDLKEHKMKVADLIKLEPEVVTLREENAVLKNKLEDLDKEKMTLLNERNKLYTENSCVKASLFEKETQCHNFERQLKELEEKVGILVEDLDKVTDKNNSLEKEKDFFKNKLSEKETLYQNLDKRTKELEEKVGILVEDLNKVTDKNNSLEKEKDFFKNKLSEKETLYQNLDKRAKELEDRYQSLQQKVNQVTAENHEFQTKGQEMECTIVQLKNSIEEHELLRRSLHNTIQDLKGNIRVFCRVRPPASIEEHEKLLCSIFAPNETNLEIRKSRESVSITGRPTDLRQEFTFDRVFPPEAGQGEVFEELAQLVQSALDGYDICVFAYGQTGSGKTYTMQGSPNDYGMIPRTIDLIFNKIRKLSLTGWYYKISVGVLEIYNENIRDLLVPNSSHNYELRYNEGRGVTVTNLKIIQVKSSQELQELMEEAQRNRAVAATDFNEHSSRSHAVTKIYVEGYNHQTKVKYTGSINLVDLAGSESARTTTVERLTETKNINKSLAALGNVMLALHNKDPHVPYRNSKLTFLLQSCLGGNSKSLMIVNISPFEECYTKSINSLRFATKVKEVKMTAKKNKTYEFR